MDCPREASAGGTIIVSADTHVYHRKVGDSIRLLRRHPDDTGYDIAGEAEYYTTDSDGQNLLPGATPTAPLELSMTAIMPATWDPCPPVSFQSPWIGRKVDTSTIDQVRMISIDASVNNRHV